MPKTLAFLADGTWDAPQNKTNVCLLSEAIPETPDVQETLYDAGVGADENLLSHVIDGAFGIALLQKVKDGYHQVALSYNQDDALFLFGFSRGAYTARSVAGMIAICGLPTKPFDETCIDVAFKAYRAGNGPLRTSLLASIADRYGLYDAKITMVGVWDTVGSLGIPAVVGGVDPVLFGFLDTSLHPDVKHAYHAVAVDERRAAFPATLWTGTFAADQTVEQVWFSGSHCDVGGSYPETGLSDITLGWMMAKAAALGLKIDPATQAKYTGFAATQALSRLHESWSPIPWGLPSGRAVPSSADLANSVPIRYAEDTTYRPLNLTFTGGVPAPSYGAEPVVAPWPPA